MAIAVGAVLLATTAGAEPRVEVSVDELTQRDRRLEVRAGTEVVWSDPHFERVWFPPASGGPPVERVANGFRAVFGKPGVYRGLYTVAGGHTSGDAYRMTVTVAGQTDHGDGSGHER
jgi:hypothetical protein